MANKTYIICFSFFALFLLIATPVRAQSEPACINIPNSELQPSKYSDLAYSDMCVEPAAQLLISAERFASKLADECSGVITNYAPYVRIVVTSIVLPPPSNLASIGAQFLAKFQEEAATCAFYVALDTLDIAPEAKSAFKAGFEAVQSTTGFRDSAQALATATGVDKGARALLRPASLKDTRTVTIKLEKAFKDGVDLVEKSGGVFDAGKSFVSRALGGPWYRVDEGVEKAKARLEECEVESASQALVNGQREGFQVLQNINSDIYFTQSALYCLREEIKKTESVTGRRPNDRRYILVGNRERDLKRLRTRFDVVTKSLAGSYRQCDKVRQAAKRVDSLKNNYADLKSKIEKELDAGSCDSSIVQSSLRSMQKLERGECGGYTTRSVSYLKGKIEDCQAPDGLIPLTVGSEEIENRLEEETEDEGRVVVKLLPLTITVVDTTAKVISGATVTAGGQSAVTNADGDANLMIPAGTVTVFASKEPGYRGAQRTVEVEAGKESYDTIALAYANVDLSVNVLGPEGPLSGAKLVLRGEGDQRSGSSGAGGVTSFRIKPGSWRVSVDRLGYRPQAKSVEVLPETGASLTLKLDYQQQPFSVRVFSDDLGPVSNAVVRVIQDGQSFTRTTNDSGTAAFEVFPGTVQVFASMSGMLGSQQILKVPPGNGFGPIVLGLKSLEVEQPQVNEPEEESSPVRDNEPPQRTNPLLEMANQNVQRGQQIRRNESDYEVRRQRGYQEDASRYQRQVNQIEAEQAAAQEYWGNQFERIARDNARAEVERRERRERDRRARERERRRRQESVARSSTNSVSPGARRPVSRRSNNQAADLEKEKERKNILRRIATLERGITANKKRIKCLKEGIKKFPRSDLDCDGRFTISSREKGLKNREAALIRDERELRDLRRKLSSLK